MLLNAKSIHPARPKLSQIHNACGHTRPEAPPRHRAPSAPTCTLALVLHSKSSSNISGSIAYAVTMVQAKEGSSRQCGSSLSHSLQMLPEESLGNSVLAGRSMWRKPSSAAITAQTPDEDNARNRLRPSAWRQTGLPLTSRPASSR